MLVIYTLREFSYFLFTNEQSKSVLWAFLYRRFLWLDPNSAGRNGDSVKILGFWHFFVSRNPRNIRPESSSLVSTSLTHSGDDDDSEDSGIISLLFLLGSPESSRRTQLRNVHVLHWTLTDESAPCRF